MRHLFIGGYADGQWIETYEHDHWTIPEPTILSCIFKSNLDAGEDVSFPTQQYRRESFRVNSTTHYIYVGIHMTTEEAIEMLINGYGKARKA